MSAWPSHPHVNPMTCASAPSRRRFNGLRAHGGVGAHVQGLTCERRTMSDTVVPKMQTTSPTAAHCQRFSPRWSALWAPHRLTSWLHCYRSGGIALHEGPTRRRHAPRKLHVVQNPQPPVRRAPVGMGGPAVRRAPEGLEGTGRRRGAGLTAVPMAGGA